MAVTNISKTSGVIFVTEGTQEPKCYFVAKGKYVPNTDLLGFQITIGLDTYNVSLSELRVNGQTPSTFTTAKTLLNAVFGT
jgi:hypothetical protein